jgi:hypothetical protein
LVPSKTATRLVGCGLHFLACDVLCLEPFNRFSFKLYLCIFTYIHTYDYVIDWSYSMHGETKTIYGIFIAEPEEASLETES